MPKIILEGWLIQDKDGSLRGTVNSWSSGSPQLFKTKIAADRYSYLGKIVPARITVETKPRRKS